MYSDNVYKLCTKQLRSVDLTSGNFSVENDIEIIERQSEVSVQISRFILLLFKICNQYHDDDNYVR